MTRAEAACSREKANSEHNEESALLRRFAQRHAMTYISGTDRLTHNAHMLIHNQERIQICILAHNPIHNRHPLKAKIISLYRDTEVPA